MSRTKQVMMSRKSDAAFCKMLDRAYDLGHAVEPGTPEAKVDAVWNKSRLAKIQNDCDLLASFSAFMRGVRDAAKGR